MLGMGHMEKLLEHGEGREGTIGSNLCRTQRFPGFMDWFV